MSVGSAMPEELLRVQIPKLCAMESIILSCIQTARRRCSIPHLPSGKCQGWELVRSISRRPNRDVRLTWVGWVCSRFFMFHIVLRVPSIDRLMVEDLGLLRPSPLSVLPPLVVRPLLLVLMGTWIGAAGILQWDPAPFVEEGQPRCPSSSSSSTHLIEKVILLRRPFNCFQPGENPRPIAGFPTNWLFSSIISLFSPYFVFLVSQSSNFSGDHGKKSLWVTVILFFSSSRLLV